VYWCDVLFKHSNPPIIIHRQLVLTGTVDQGASPPLAAHATLLSANLAAVRELVISSKRYSLIIAIPQFGHPHSWIVPSSFFENNTFLIILDTFRIIWDTFRIIFSKKYGGRAKNPKVCNRHTYVRTYAKKWNMTDDRRAGYTPVI
jgi:hypothetical protein